MLVNRNFPPTDKIILTQRLGHDPQELGHKGLSFLKSGSPEKKCLRDTGLNDSGSAFKGKYLDTKFVLLQSKRDFTVPTLAMS